MITLGKNKKMFFGASDFRLDSWKYIMETDPTV